MLEHLKSLLVAQPAGESETKQTKVVQISSDAKKPQKAKNSSGQESFWVKALLRTYSAQNRDMNILAPVSL